MIDESVLRLPPRTVVCPACGRKMDVSSFDPESEVRCPGCRTRVAVPNEFGVFQLYEKLSSSENASVFRAFDPMLERPLAIKIAHPFLQEARQSLQQQIFFYPAQISALLNQHAVVRIYGCGIESGYPYMIMELLSNRTIAELGRGKAVEYSAEQVLENVFTVAVSLAAAARHSIGHHELWPGNLLLDGYGHVRLLNFRLPPNPLAEPVIPSENCPFIRYLSPERLTAGEESLASDVYSLGAIAYELFSGVHPFELYDLGEMIDAQFGNSFVSLARREPTLDPMLSSLIDRMLNAMPFDRPEYPEISVTMQTALEKMIEARNASGLFSRLQKYFSRNG